MTLLHNFLYFKTNLIFGPPPPSFRSTSFCTRRYFGTYYYHIIGLHFINSESAGQYTRTHTTQLACDNCNIGFDFYSKILVTRISMIIVYNLVTEFNFRIYCFIISCVFQYRRWVVSCCKLLKCQADYTNDLLAIIVIRLVFQKS